MGGITTGLPKSWAVPTTVSRMKLHEDSGAVSWEGKAVQGTKGADGVQNEPSEQQKEV